MIASQPFRGFHRFQRRTLALEVMMVLMLLSILPAWGADKAKDEETIGNATTVLTAMLSAQEVPADVVTKADCVMVIPNLKKFGFGIGGSGGRGPMSCRRGNDFSGKWSAPAMYTTSGASVGLQIGGSSTDFVVLLMNKKAVETLLNGTIKLGRDATAAAGPGVTAATVGGDVLTYGRSKGLFAGVSLGDATMTPDDNANQRLYGKSVSATDIIRRDAVQPTTAGQSFVDLLNSKVATHGS